MTGNEIAVVVIDPVPSADEDARTTAEVAADRSHGILEGGLLVAVGLSALAVEGIVSAILRVVGDSDPVRSWHGRGGTGRGTCDGTAGHGHRRGGRRRRSRTSRSRRAGGSCGSLPVSSERSGHSPSWR